MKLSIVRNLLVGSGLLTLVFLLPACKDFLEIDSYFDDEFQMDSVFTNVRNMEAYMWGASNHFWPQWRILRHANTPGIMATDEAYNGVTTSASSTVYPGGDFASGYINPEYYGSGGILDQWGNYYKVIRKTTEILNHIDDPKDMTIDARNRIVGNSHFLRGFAYYNLLMDYGPPIILGDDEVVPSNESLEAYDRQRSTYDEAVEYICNEFEQAAALLPTEISVLEMGRPTRGAALALIARVRLIHASPLFNGGEAAHSYYGNWIRKGGDGQEEAYYVSQNYDERRWAVAAAAAKRVMEMNGRGGPKYSLYTVPADNQTPELPQGVTSDPNYYNDFPNGAAGIDPYHSYKDIFSGEAVAAINPELIWAQNIDVNSDDFFLRGTLPAELTGWNRWCIPQKIIDAYLMNDGRTIDQAKIDGYYSESGFTTTTKFFSGYTLLSDTYKMYDNREPRFYASIGFNNALWPSLSSQTINNHVADYFFQHADGRGGVTATSPNYPITGYVNRKWYHPMDARSGSGATYVPKAFAIIRYAEILLSYAEALNNLTQSYTIEVDGKEETFSRNIEEIRRTFNMVRYRAGLPGLSASQLADPQEVQKQIERERMVEFLWENRRFYDVRRWGIYEESERAPIVGMNPDGATKESYYQRVVNGSSRIQGRVVDKKLVWLPIPRKEIRRLPSLDQNPGW